MANRGRSVLTIGGEAIGRGCLDRDGEREEDLDARNDGCSDSKRGDVPSPRPLESSPSELSFCRSPPPSLSRGPHFYSQECLVESGASPKFALG